MSTPSYSRSLTGLCKRLKLSSSTIGTSQPVRYLQQSARAAAQLDAQQTTSAGTSQSPPTLESVEQDLNALRLPKAVQAAYLQPLRHPHPRNRVKVCELQLRSYSVRNLEVFADFAARAAYYLKLPITLPRPLPQITERWTVPRSNFVHKKSQENFERKTLRRVIEVFNGHPTTVAVWLAFLRKHQYYGVGMKANVWERSGLDVVERMDGATLSEEQRAKEFDAQFQSFGVTRQIKRLEAAEAEDVLLDQPFKAMWGASAALAASGTVPHANARFEKIVVHTQPRPDYPRSAREASHGPKDSTGELSKEL